MSVLTHAADKPVNLMEMCFKAEVSGLWLRRLSKYEWQEVAPPPQKRTGDETLFSSTSFTEERSSVIT